MKFEKQQVYYVVLAFVVCFAIMSYWNTGAGILQKIYNAAFPFLIGAAIAYVVNIVMSVYENLYTRIVKVAWLLKVKRAISMILAYLTFILSIVWLFSIVLPDLISSLSALSKIDPTAVSTFISELGENKLISQLLQYVGKDADLSATLTSYGQQILQQVLAVLTNVLISVTTIASTVLNVFVSLIFSFYVLANKEQLGRQFTLLTDTYLGRFAKNVHYFVDILHQRFHGFFVSQTLEAIILGSLTAIGMTLFKMPFAATIGVLVAFTALIPVVGAYIGVTIGFILIATQSVNQAVAFVIFLVILQQFEGNLIYPRVVGGSIGLPGMWVLLAITLGATLWGVGGMLIAVPLTATIYQVIKDNVHKRQLSQKNSKSISKANLRAEVEED